MTRNQTCLLLVLATAASLAACGYVPGVAQQAPMALVGQVEIVELEPAAEGARTLELRLAGDERYTLSDHGVAMLMALQEKPCDELSMVFDGRQDSFPSGEAHPEAGQPLSMQLTCQPTRLPHHRSLEPGTPVGGIFDAPAGAETKAAYTRIEASGESPALAANRLIGGLLRDAYTEDCGQQRMVVERIDTATESGAEQTLHAQLAFRCLDTAPDDA